MNNRCESFLCVCVCVGMVVCVCVCMAVFSQLLLLLLLFAICLVVVRFAYCAIFVCPCSDIKLVAHFSSALSFCECVWVGVCMSWWGCMWMCVGSHMPHKQQQQEEKQQWQHVVVGLTNWLCLILLLSQLCHNLESQGPPSKKPTHLHTHTLYPTHTHLHTHRTMLICKFCVPLLHTPSGGYWFLLLFVLFFMIFRPCTQKGVHGAIDNKRIELSWKKWQSRTNCFIIF